MYVLENSSYLNGEDANPVFNGILLFVQDEAEVVYDETRSDWFSLIEDSSDCNWIVDATAPLLVPYDYEIRFTETGDTATYPPTMITPFEIWNVSTDKQVQFSSFNPPATDTTQEMRQNWTSGDPLTIREDVDGVMKFTWIFTLTANPDTLIDTLQVTPDSAFYDTTYVDNHPPEQGDVAKVFTKKPLTSNDNFRLSVKMPGKREEKSVLDNIKVVPNPYIAVAQWEPRSDAIGRGPRKIYFTHLPQKCTIRIYTVYGNLIRKIEHESTVIDGSEEWDLRSDNDMDVAFGVYIYHVDCEAGEKIGKLALIK